MFMDLWFVCLINPKNYQIQNSKVAKTYLKKMIPYLLLQCFKDADGPKNFISLVVTNFIKNETIKLTNDDIVTLKLY